jgi:KUP system potassium uptake protein
LPTTRGRLAALTLAAIGIVYGDMGTSPLYTLNTVFSQEHGLQLTHANLPGVISLIFRGLMVIVSLKYVSLVLRADNQGEGGIMALMALAMSGAQQGAARAHHLPDRHPCCRAHGAGRRAGRGQVAGQRMP